jgi:hypothetical protein
MSGSEDRLARLCVTRDQIRDALASCGAASLIPGLAREYRLILAEIDSLHIEDSADVVDEIAARRKAAAPRRAKRSS